MPEHLSLDAHAHLDPRHSTKELADAGAVLAMTLSLAEADKVMHREDPLIAWGVGCHPRKLAAQQAFDPGQFAELAGQTAIIGEVGLDVSSQVPLERQLKTLRSVFSYAGHNPRIVSIHSFGKISASGVSSTSLILEELRNTPIIAPILHWWTGTAAETRRAVDLGCYFSVHSAVARRSIFRTQVPMERLLVESDHGWADPPGAIPHRVIWVEYLLSASLGINVSAVRHIVWQNFAEVVRLTDTHQFLPPKFSSLLV